MPTLKERRLPKARLTGWQIHLLMARPTDWLMDSLMRMLRRLLMPRRKGLQMVRR